MTDLEPRFEATSSNVEHIIAVPCFLKNSLLLQRASNVPIYRSWKCFATTRGDEKRKNSCSLLFHSSPYQVVNYQVIA